MAFVIVNRAAHSTATSGTGTLTLGTALAGFQTFAAAGVSDADTLPYVIEDNFDINGVPADWEIGLGTYTSAGTLLARTTVYESTNGGSAISCSGTDTIVFLGPRAEDLGGGGDVTKVGTPVNDQIGLWTGDGTIEGNIGLTYSAGLFLANSIQLGGTHVGRNDTDDETTFNASTSTGHGGIRHYGPTHATKAEDIEFLDGTVIKGNYDASASTWTFATDLIIEASASNSYIYTNDTDNRLRIAAGNGSTSGPNILMHGPSYISNANDITFNIGTLNKLQWDNSAASWKFGDRVEDENAVEIQGNIGQQTIYVPASAMVPRSTNGPALAALELTTNDVMVSSLDYDTATEEAAQFGVQMPKSWNAGAVILQPIWSHAATATNFGVVWGFRGKAYSNGLALDGTWGGEVTSTDTGGTTNDLYIGPETSAMTFNNGPVAEEWCLIEVSRVVANGSDNMAIDARLHGFKIHYTTDAGTDD